jgi:hypothetical protein
MRKKAWLLPLIGCVLCLASCSSKLSTIRPTLITRITLEDVETEERSELKRDQSEEMDWLMDDLVLQMEQFYKKTGSCTQEDQHIYQVDYYRGDILEMSVIVNADASVCIQDKHYELADKNDEEIAEYRKGMEKAFSHTNVTESDE